MHPHGGCRDSVRRGRPWRNRMAHNPAKQTRRPEVKPQSANQLIAAWYIFLTGLGSPNGDLRVAGLSANSEAMPIGTS
jgi:hypothetical protein